MSLLAPLVVDLGVSQIPHAVFTVIHLAILTVAIVLVVRTTKAAGSPRMMWGFVLIAAGELVYIGYHLKWTTFLLSHTISEVLVLVAILLFFTSMADRRA